MRGGPRAGFEFVVTSLSLKDYASAREECLQEERRRRLDTQLRNIDLLPESHRESAVEKAMASVQSLQYEDLDDRVLELEGQRQKVDPGLHWMVTEPSGQVFSVWLSIRAVPSQQHISLSEVHEMFRGNFQELEDVANCVGRLSQTRLEGNGAAPHQAGETRRQRRKKRRNA